jgi:hypothetical protein
MLIRDPISSMAQLFLSTSPSAGRTPSLRYVGKEAASSNLLHVRGKRPQCRHVPAVQRWSAAQARTRDDEPREDTDDDGDQPEESWRLTAAEVPGKVALTMTRQERPSLVVRTRG